MILRAIPLRPTGERTGGIVLLRDVTELRRRDRELVTKDATIREIHHRVKNNLQTVAALLRLQARRIGVPEGRVALEEAVRRVGAIAVVHETLSQAFDETVDFDEVDRPADPAGDRRGQRRRADPHPAYGLVRGDQLRRRHAAGDGLHRAASRTPWSTPSTPRSAGRWSSTAPARATGCGWSSRTTDAGCPTASGLEDAAQPGPVDRQHARGRARRDDQPRGARGRTRDAGRRPGAERERTAALSAAVRRWGRVRPIRRCGPGRGRCGA